MQLAYRVIGQLIDSNQQCAKLFSENLLDSEFFPSSKCVIGDIVGFVVSNLSRRALHSLLSLDWDDYMLLTRLIRLSICFLVAITPTRDPEALRKALAPTLIEPLNLLNRLLSASLPHYFFTHSDNNKFPLHAIIQLSNVKIPTCAEPLLIYHLERMIKEALNSSALVCNPGFFSKHFLIVRFIYIYCAV